MSLPTDRDARNALPVWDGCIAYFPDAWAEIAKVSAAGNKQHGLGGPLRWERKISTDHCNKVMRHMLDHQSGAVLDDDGCFHLAKAAWRILAALQLAIEANNQKTLFDEIEALPSVPVTSCQMPPTGPQLILRLQSEELDQIGDLTDERVRSHQERGDASGFGQVAQCSNNLPGHSNGGKKGSSRSEAC